jgi:hypothetical protein
MEVTMKIFMFLCILCSCIVCQGISQVLPDTGIFDPGIEQYILPQSFCQWDRSYGKEVDTSYAKIMYEDTTSHIVKVCNGWVVRQLWVLYGVEGGVEQSEWRVSMYLDGKKRHILKNVWQFQLLDKK